ncbi:MAG: ABC transporter permease [Patescibacteria group bacterium]
MKLKVTQAPEEIINKLNMKLRDIFTEVYTSLSSNKIRSGLTMLGVVIGISSVIVLVGVGQGATSSITSNISSLGSNLIIVAPGSTSTSGVRSAMGSASTLTQDDADAIATEVSSVSGLASVVTTRQQITYKNSNTNAQIIGTEANYADVRNVIISSGSFITTQDQKSVSKVAVIGPSTSETLFGEGVDPVGKTIKINKIQFKVVGLAQSKGGSTTDSSDYAVYIPMATAQRYLTGRGTLSISNIYVKAVDENSVSATKTAITNLLLERHNISDSSSADFTASTQEDLMSSLSSVSTTLSLLLGCIAGISLLVGGIGIMNMMLTTVTERTREIGLRKAVGAKRSDISIQFLSESVALTFVSGIIGAGVGLAVAKILTSLNVLTSVITWQSIVYSFGICAFVGIIFGIYPANKAAKLKPIDALRYE